MSTKKGSKDAASTVVLIGYPGVGKTTLVNCLRGAEFEPPTATHGVISWSLDGVSENGPTHSVTLLDLGGNAPTTLNTIDFSIAVVVVDPTRESVDKDVAHWSELLESTNDDPLCKRLLVTSQIDRGGVVIDKEELKNVSVKYGFSGVYQTSAKVAYGIQELRSAIIEASKSHDEEKEPETPVQIVVRTLATELCKLIATEPQALRDIEWRDLERVLATALEGIGFDVKLTPPAKDGGKDIIAHCIVENERQVFYVEIKHWREKGRPGLQHISDFIEVNAVDRTYGGLFVSSSGFSKAVHGRLSEISKQRVRLGESNKIVSLCQRYVKSCEGLWQHELPLPEVLFEETL